MEQELINIREEVRYLSGAVSEATAETKAALGRIEGLLTDIRALLLYQTTGPGQDFKTSMDDVRDLTSEVTAR